MVIFLYIVLILSGVIIFLTAAEIIALLSMKSAQELPDEDEAHLYTTEENGKSFAELYLYLSGEECGVFFTEDEIYSLIKKQCLYMEKRFDCADFRAQLLIKIYKDCGDSLSVRVRELIKNTFLGFKYFMDEPGCDSMCYWSENHQLLFAVCEYLAGDIWKNELFTNSNMTGAEHKKKAKIRIEAWMKQRFDYGFSEYLSNNYLAEDICPMANYIAYCDDKESALRMKIIMDILWLDVALNSVNNRFASVSSRMYGNNKAGNFYGNSIQMAMNILWGNESISHIQDTMISDEERALIQASLEKKPNHIVICFTDIVKKGIYTLPTVIKDIALTKDSFVSLMHCGLSPSLMKKDGLIGTEPYQIMAQWGAEAFTNPEVIENSFEYVKKHKMYRNSFIGYFRFLNLSVLKFIKLSAVAEKINMMPHGIATGECNIITYRTPYYALSTSVSKDTGMCGAQEHIWNANISEALSLFTTHPAGNGNGRYASSPGYWIGNGRRPQSVQHQNVNITVYKLPEKIRLGETGISDITHAYMPREFYDEFELCGNYVFARKNGVFVAMISDSPLMFREYNSESAAGLLKYRNFPEKLKPTDVFDLIRQGGKYHTYVTELSHCGNETFDGFRERIKNNKVSFSSNGRTEYTTLSGKITVSYAGEFTVNGRECNKEYDRYDSKFCKAPRKTSVISINSGSNRLYLDFNNNLRKQG